MGKIIAVTFMLLLSCSSSVFSAAVSDTWESNRLFNVMADANTSNILECVHMKDIDSCTKIDIDFEAMMQSDDIIMAEDDFIFKRKYSTEDENGQSQSFSYEGANFSYAVLTYSEAPGYPDLNGRIHYTKDGASYMIDNCGENCHVLIKLGKGLMEIKEPIESPVAPGVSALSAEELDPVTRDALALGQQETRNTATVSIYVYYTPQFRSRVSDPTGHIRNLIATTNTAFANTQIPLRLSEFCIGELNSGESSNTDQRLRNFWNAKGSLSNLLNTADIAILMTSTGSSDASGAAYLGPTSQTGAPPIGWVQLGHELIFTHEVGHIFGAHHNREVAGNGNGFNYGYLLRGSNMLTVMAYFSGNYRQWIPYFSNDDFTVNGVQMGTAGDDNRRQLTDARFVVANRGNEAGTCSSGGGGGGGDGGTCDNARGDSNCDYWAGLGFCTQTYVAFMQENCRKACALCGGGSNCADSNANCPFWASYGYCVHSYVSYMRENCRASCNVC